MINTICLNKNFSTTKLLIEEKPTLENRPEDKFETVLFLPRDENRKGEGGLRTKGYFKKSYEEKSLVTVITVVFNGAAYLEETILSVLNQTYDNIEYIVIDGGSTDGTLNIIKKYDDKIDYWVSESDKGIYDAFNKGISLSTGCFIGILNADDYYALNTIDIIKNSILEYKEIDVFHANIYLHNEEFKRKKLIKPSSISNLKKYMSINHPTCFVRSSIYHNYNFNEQYSICADYDFITKLYLNGFSFKHIDFLSTHMRDGGVSSSSKSLSEVYVIIKSYFGTMPALKAYILKFLKKSIKSISLLIISKRKWVEKRYKD